MYIVRWVGRNGNMLYGFKGLRSKMLTGWTGLDTPQTVMTTRAPTVLKTPCIIALIWVPYFENEKIHLRRQTHEAPPYTA